MKIIPGDMQRVFLRSVKAGLEHRCANIMHGYELDLGYTYYSKEDQTSVRGLYAGLAYNNYVLERGDHRFILKVASFYQVLYLEDYLKYSSTSPVYGSYFEYRKTKYSKERIGLSLLNTIQIQPFSHLAVDFCWGAGFIFFKTNTPAAVTQNDFRSGFFRMKEYAAPNFVANLKLGYAF